jgi:hypothetical protein
MKKLCLLVSGIIFSIILVLLIFNLSFIIGTITSNQPKKLDTNSLKTYRAEIEKQYADISNINIYHRFGRIFFEFETNSSMTLEEYKNIVRKTKDFIQREGVTSLLPKGYGEQQSLVIEFKTKESKYSFNSSYWIPTPDTTDNANISEKNNYKVWYLNINDESESKVEF